jgi:hypothetical protein
MLAQRFILSVKMLRDLLHIVPIKNLAEELLNSWLTYATSQPVNFDLTVIGIFVLQYTGFHYLKQLRVRVAEKIGSASN